MKDKLFSLFFCLYIFWSPLSCAILEQQGLSMDGGIMRMLLLIITVISFLFYTLYGRTKYDHKVWMVMIVFGILFYSTRFLYNYSNDGYQGQFLRWGSDCVSACLIGMTLMKVKDYSYIHKILPLICIILTPFFVQNTLEHAFDQGQMILDSGMSYQSVAYNLAVIFCISLYYVFINRNYTSKLVRYVMMVCMPIHAVTCCMSGGRGGVVLLVVYIAAMCMLILKHRLISKTKLSFIIILGVLVFILVANHLGLWMSAGFERSSGLLSDDDRFLFWKQMWVYIVDNNFLGYGLGGDYFTYGFYTHNIFIDFLLETGVLGTIILIVLLYRNYKRIVQYSYSNEIFVLLLIISIYGLVMNLFSGYWITTYTHWLILGVAMTCKYHDSNNSEILRYE